MAVLVFAHILGGVCTGVGFGLGLLFKGRRGAVRGVTGLGFSKGEEKNKIQEKKRKKNK